MLNVIHYILFRATVTYRFPKSVNLPGPIRVEVQQQKRTHIKILNEIISSGETYCKSLNSATVATNLKFNKKEHRTNRVYFRYTRSARNLKTVYRTQLGE